ncbi:Increased DNA methylation 1 [Linum perenne]
MAKGTDSGKVRPGLKREFEFALKSQSEINGSLGRTRARKPQTDDNVSVVALKRYKRLRRGAEKEKESVVAVEEEAKSDVVELSSEDEEIVQLQQPKGCDMAHASSAEEIEERKDEVSVKELMNSEGCDQNVVETVIDSSREGISTSMPDLMDGDLRKFVSDSSQGDVEIVCDERASGLDVDLVNCKLEEKPYRRFTRSALKEKAVVNPGLEYGDEDNVGISNSSVVCGLLATVSASALVGDDIGSGTEKLGQNKCSKFERSQGDGGNVSEDGNKVIVKSEVDLDDSNRGKEKNMPTRRLTRSTLKLGPKTVVRPQMNERVSADKPILHSVEVKVENAPGTTPTQEIVNADKPILHSAEVQVDNAPGSPTIQTTAVASRNDGLVKPSRKTLFKSKFPANMRELLASGVLEGQGVKYIRGCKVRVPRETGLLGIIMGSLILCSCDRCKGEEAVSPAVFELHAGSSNKRPPEYTYLNSGNSLRDLMNTCKNTSLKGLEEALRLSIGCLTLKKANFCLNCRGSMADVVTQSSMILCSSCVEINNPNASLSTDICMDDSPGSPEPLLLPRTSQIAPKSLASQSKSQGKFTRNPGSPEPLLLPRTFETVPKSSASQSKSQGRLTRKDLRLHKLVFEEDVLPDGTEVAYYSRGQKLLVGYKKGFGIVCSCCNNEQKDMFLERNANAIAAGRVAGVDFMEDINKRCIRIVKTMDADFGGCAFCRGHDFDKSFGPRTVILCDQCEKEFHVGCLRDNNMQDLKELPEGNWFCCKECDTIHSSLQKLVVRGEEKLTDEVIKQKQKQNSMETEESFDIRWRLLCERVDSSDDSSILLSDAVTIFHERFDPIVVDGPGRQGDRDLIPSMVHGRNIKGQELGGMYCAVLLVNHVVVSAAIFRVFGQELAELPLVATRSQFQGQGYFQVLYDRIEQLLGLLGVKTFVLPAAEEAESIWMKKFGFSKMTHDEVLKYRKSYQTMVFQGTSMLQKPIPKSPTIVKSESS